MKTILKLFLGLIVLIAMLFAIDQYIPALLAEKLPKADKVLVKKAERKLYLMKNNSVLKSYDIGLGKNPVGHKQREGDSKTPEGKYILDYRNPESDYHLSIHISYPDKKDLQQADGNGYSAGGDIMIHGKPNYYGWVPFVYDNTDWTDGCIAVGNIDIEEIWQAVDDSTEIELLP
ncbi:MAG: L,D-transpeptidase family protein [Ignavibacteria bacterium]|nr:L,D-transpeptidase family protein [Ignavibacteria bacterium]